MTDTSRIEQRLAKNRAKREAAETTIGGLRDELASLLAEGRAAGGTVAALARAAGISRETAHKLLRRRDAR